MQISPTRTRVEGNRPFSRWHAPVVPRPYRVLNDLKRCHSGDRGQRVTTATSSRHAHLIARAALVASTTSTAFVLAVDRQVSNPLHVAAVVVACAAYGVMLGAEHRWGGLTIGWVVGAMVAPVAAALSIMPQTGDVWSYAAYGRMLAVHHVNPWTHAPAAFPLDPFSTLVGRTWSHTPSVYGPAFTALSAAGAAVLGHGLLPTRLFYQGIAVIALGGGGILIWRQTRSAAAVAFLTVHPMAVIYLVNGGRNDILVGVAMLGAVVLTTQDRPGAAGIVAAIGALVKLTGVVGLIALLATTAVRGDRKALQRMASAAGAVFGLGYLIAGVGALFAPLQTAGALYSRGSPWSIVHYVGATQPDPHVALALLAALVVIVIARHRHATPGTAVTASLAMLGLAASYTLPGYLAWGLPAAALDHRSRVSRIVAGAGVVLVVTYEIVRHPFAGDTGHALFAVATIGGPVLMLALVVGLLRTRTHQTQETTPMTMTAPVACSPSRHDLRRVLVVIPTLDERANIETVLTRVRESLPEADVLIVDDGSTDGTAEMAEAVSATRGRIEVLRRIGPARAWSCVPSWIRDRALRGLRHRGSDGRRPLA